MPQTESSVTESYERISLREVNITLAARLSNGDTITYVRKLTSYVPFTRAQVIRFLERQKMRPMGPQCATCPFRTNKGKLDVSRVKVSTKSIWQIWRCHDKTEYQCTGAALATQEFVARESEANINNRYYEDQDGYWTITDAKGVPIK